MNVVGLNSTESFANWPQEWVTARGLSKQSHSSPCLTAKSLKKRTFSSSEKSVITPSQMLLETTILPVPRTVKIKVLSSLFKDFLNKGTGNKKYFSLNLADLITSTQTEPPSLPLCLIPQCLTSLFTPSLQMLHCLMCWHWKAHQHLDSIGLLHQSSPTGSQASPHHRPLLVPWPERRNSRGLQEQTDGNSVTGTSLGAGTCESS